MAIVVQLYCSSAESHLRFGYKSSLYLKNKVGNDTSQKDKTWILHFHTLSSSWLNIFVKVKPNTFTVAKQNPFLKDFLVRDADMGDSQAVNNQTKSQLMILSLSPDAQEEVCHSFSVFR